MKCVAGSDFAGEVLVDLSCSFLQDFGGFIAVFTWNIINIYVPAVGCITN